MLNEYGLTDKEENFCHFYILEAQDATKAYKSAGYKAKNDNVAAVSAHKLLKKPKIEERIRQMRESRDNINSRSRKKILDKLWEACEEADPKHADKIVKLADQIARYEGWHSPQKYDIDDQRQSWRELADELAGKTDTLGGVSDSHE